MKPIQPNDYNTIETRRPLQRRAEEMLRAEASRFHKRRTLKNLMKTGFKIRRTHVAHKYLKESNEVVQHACDIFLARLISKNKENSYGLSREEIITKGIKQFEKLDPETMSYYLSAAIIDDPNKSVPIASNAYHNFLVLHVEKKKRGRQNSVDDAVIKEGRLMWNRLKPHQKFPFFMLAYFNTYYPREVDGSVQATLEKLPKAEVNQFMKNTKKTLQRFDAFNSFEPTEFAKNTKKMTFDPLDPVHCYIK